MERAQAHILFGRAHNTWYEKNENIKQEISKEHHKFLQQMAQIFYSLRNYGLVPRNRIYFRRIHFASGLALNGKNFPDYVPDLRPGGAFRADLPQA